MALPPVIGGVAAGMSLISSIYQGGMYGSAASSAMGRSIFAARQRYMAGVQESQSYKRTAHNFYLEANANEKVRDQTLRDIRRTHKVSLGRSRGQQQGLARGGTSIDRLFDQQESVARNVVAWKDWEMTGKVRALEDKARESNWLSKAAMVNAVNEANMTLYSGALEASHMNNMANLTMLTAIPNAAMAGVSAYATAGGSFAPAATATPGGAGASGWAFGKTMSLGGM